MRSTIHTTSLLDLRMTPVAEKRAAAAFLGRRSDIIQLMGSGRVIRPD